MKENLQGHILVVDDNKLNRMLLLRLLNQLGHEVTQAEHGIEALHILKNPETKSIDVVLLDIIMPEMDGYGLLNEIKADERLRNIPVIMTSALDELDSVVRCIESGATDYLTKPVQSSLLKARLKSSLAEKRLRDLEVEYLEQVGHVVSAAEAVESEKYDPGSLQTVAARADALGRLARVFQKMATEVHLREQRLKQQLQQLQLDVEEMQRALAEELNIYLPMDRRQALYHNKEIPVESSGAVLFADISDFTKMTDSLAREHGRARGAEEITRLINQIFSVIVDEAHSFKGSVISFGGDAITCWFDDQPIGNEPAEDALTASLRAVTCGLHMQNAVRQIETLTPVGTASFQPDIKVVIVSGSTKRFLVGDPEIQYLEALVGNPLDNLPKVEQHVERGEVIVDSATYQPNKAYVSIQEIRSNPDTGEEYAVIAGLQTMIQPDPWRELPEQSLTNADCRPWLHPTVYRHVLGSTKQFLAELRSAVAMFVFFEGIDFYENPDSDVLLDEYFKWVQKVIHSEGGAILQLTFGDKGSYMYATFGAPTTHEDDAVRAIQAAHRILRKPARFQAIRPEQIGISLGDMRAGSYGGHSRRTYGVIGNKTNLAARLMQAAAAGEIICDQETFEAAQERFEFETLPKIRVKGREDLISVYRPLVYESQNGDSDKEAQKLLDAQSPAEQMVVKLASVIGRVFDRKLLLEIMPDNQARDALEHNLERLVETEVIKALDENGGYRFSMLPVYEVAYQSLLYVQRRHLHRQIAAAMEAQAEEISPQEFALLAHHWESAEEKHKAAQYLEKAGQHAQSLGNYEQAELYFQKSLELDRS